jgi:hypothetical protein
MKKTIVLFAFFIPTLSLLAQQISGLQAISDCKTMPQFAYKVGIDPGKAAFSTTERRTIGVALIQIDTKQETQKAYQDASWKKYGAMGPIAIDEKGTLYSAPIPFVGVSSIGRQNQNNIYKINPTTGKMEILCNLSFGKKSSEQNAYGILGMFYDCESKLLYVSSINGSTREQEAGTIYCINPTTGAVIDQWEGIDAMGIGIARFNGNKVLFIGKIRDNSICLAALEADGKFVKKANPIITLLEAGPRGDDVCKKIRFKNNQMTVTGMEFYYNLTAPTQKQESVYTYQYNSQIKRWQLVGIDNSNLVVGF